MARKSANGKLVAAGVMEIIQAAIGLIIGLWLFSLSQNAVIQFLDGASGGAISLVAIIMLVIGGVTLAAAIGCLQARMWAIITTIILQSIALLLLLIGLTANNESAGGAVISLAYIGTVLGLVIAGLKELNRS